MSRTEARSMRDYDSDRYGPFLGVSDGGPAAEAIRDAAAGSPKARALGHDPFIRGIGHDAERLRSVGEVPVGPDEYSRIIEVAAGQVLITTNVGSHVNLWHSLQPPGRDLDPDTSAHAIAVWARENGHDFRVREPQPWLRLRPHSGLADDQRRELIAAASAEAPVCIAVTAEQGADEALRALQTAAAAGASAVVVDGIARPPSAGRPALPGLLNYYPVGDTRKLLARAHELEISIEPALKIDTGSVSNQIWAGLHAAQSMGLHLGKYGLFPLTFREAEQVVANVQRWMADWTAAPAFYLDVPWVDGHQVYEPGEALVATERWLTMVAAAGAQVVLLDTVDKSSGRRLLNDTHAGAETDPGILSWREIDLLEKHAADHHVRILWAGGIELKDVRAFGQQGVFGIYVTTAASELRPVEGGSGRTSGSPRQSGPSRPRSRSSGCCSTPASWKTRRSSRRPSTPNRGIRAQSAASKRPSKRAGTPA